MFDLYNKVALVTGANRGIGKAIVEAFLENGAKKVYAAVRNLESTTELVAQFGEKIQPVYIDLSKPESIIELAKSATDVDIVVNNAGVLKQVDFLDNGFEEALNFELSINVFGLINIAKAFAPILEKNARPDSTTAFVQLNSVASITNFTGITSYSASKAAAYSITQGIHAIFKEKNVEVFSVHPGPINTDMAQSIGLVDGEAPSTVAKSLLQTLSSGTFHCFPDVVAKTMSEAYHEFSEKVILPNIQE